MNREGKLNEAHIQRLNTDFTRDDVKRIMFSIPDGKAPGANGVNSKFYKHGWDIAGKEVTDAILDFSISSMENC